MPPDDRDPSRPRLEGAQHQPVGPDSPPVGGAAPVGAVPVGAAPIDAAPVGAAPVGAAPVGAAPVGAAPVGAAPVGAAPVGAAPVSAPPAARVSPATGRPPARIPPAIVPKPIGTWGFIKTYPWLVLGLCLAIMGLAGGDGWLVYKRGEYEREVTRLRQGMTGVERRRADVVFAANKDHFRIMVELIRRQAEGDRALHLSVAVDRGEMYLEREGVRLRQMSVRVGPDSVVGQGAKAVHVAAPRGQRTVAGVAAWSITLDGGTTIYADSGRDVLTDRAGVTPGNVRIPATDMEAILPDVKPGMSVYFF
jgi:hypothetical protein